MPPYPTVTYGITIEMPPNTGDPLTVDEIAVALEEVADMSWSITVGAVTPLYPS